MEPFTVAAIAGVAGAGLKTVIGGCVESLADRALSDVTRELMSRIGGLRGLPANHDAARALRRAQLQALRLIIRQYDKSELPEWAEDPINKPEIFISEAKSFVSNNLSLCVSIEVTDELAEKLSQSMEGALTGSTDKSASNRLGVSRALAEDAVIEELQAELGATAVPESFVARFKSTAEDGQGWFEAFGLFLAEELKADERFRSIFTATKLSSLEGLALDGLDIVNRIDQRADQMADDLEFVRGQVGAIADAQTRQTDLLEQIAAKLGLDVGSEEVELRLGELGTAHNASRAEILGLLKDIIGEGVPAGQINEAIGKARQSLSATREELERLRSLSNEAPEIEPDLAAARAALENADIVELEKAQTAIRHARERYLEVISARRVQESDNLSRLYESEAKIALARSRSLDAARLFGEAAEVAPREDNDRRRFLFFEQASALQGYGTMFAGLDSLHEAAAVLRFKVLPGMEYGSADWFSAQSTLGDILQTICVRAGGSEAKAAGDQALSIYEELHAACDRETAPIEWAQLQNRRGILFRSMSDRRIDERNVWLDRAIEAYDEAIAVYAEHDMKADRALVQTNAANILKIRGELAPPYEGKPLLEAAIKNYRSFLEYVTRDEDPMNWAIGKNNLGDAYHTLGKILEGAEQEKYFDLAEEMVGEALKVRTREAMPKDWATSRSNLAGIKLSRAERETDTAKAIAGYEGVIADHDELLEVHTRADMARGWADRKYYIGFAYSRIAGLSEGQAQFDALWSAAEAYRDSLEVYTKADFPLDWARSNVDLGDMLSNMSKCAVEADLAEKYLRDAIGCYLRSLEVYDTKQYAAPRVGVLRQLGDIEYRLGRHFAASEERVTLLECSLERFNEALEIFDKEEDPGRWVQLQFDVAVSHETLADMGLHEKRVDHAAAAIIAYENAASTYKAEDNAQSWFVAVHGAARALKLLGENTTEGSRLEHFDASIKRYAELIKESPEDVLPPNRAKAQFEMAMALVRFDQIRDDSTKTDVLVLAEEPLQEFLKYSKEQKSGEDAAIAHKWLGNIAIALGNRTGDAKLVKKGANSLKKASKLYKQEGLEDPAIDAHTAARLALYELRKK